MILLTNTLTRSPADKTEAIDLRGLALPGSGGVREGLRPHTISAEFSMSPYVLADRQVGNLSLTPLFSRCGCMKMGLLFHAKALFSAGYEKLGWSSFCIPAS